MKMALDTASGVNVVKSYEPGVVQIRDQRFTKSLVVLPDKVLTEWPPKLASELRPTHFSEIIGQRPEVLIIGTGESQVFPDPAALMTLMDMGIGYEVMDNAAACRTYNILVSEDRRTALALIFRE